MSDKKYRKYFGKRFHKQKDGYWANMMPIHAHRWVWINHNGAIPEGMDIHHIDGNKDNNEIENLKMLSRSEHLKEHWRDERYKRMQQLNKVRPLDWLKSKEGKKSVSKKGKEVWKNREPKEIICENCGTKAFYKRWARFCNKNCYMKWIYKNKVNFIAALCPICDKVFKKPKSKKTKFCSPSCAYSGKSKI